MKKGKRKKKYILLLGAVIVAAVGVGIFFTAKGGAEPVNVYPFRYIGMTEYWGDSRESYGPVTTDQIQTVFLSDTQTVTEILVQPGDKVKKGDILMSFDTTLNDLALERKRLDVEKLKLQQTAAREKLTQIQNMTPMDMAEDTQTNSTVETVDLGTALKGSYKLSTNREYNGSTPETAMICWLSSETVVNDELLEAMRLHSESFRGTQARTASSASAEVVEEIAEEAAEEEVFEEIIEEEIVEEVLPEEPPEEPEPSTEHDVPDASEPIQEPEGSEPPDVPVETLPQMVESYYVVFKITTGNMSLGMREVWQGVQVYGDSSTGFSLKFFNAAMVPDHTLAQQESTGEDYEYSEEDPGSGYTAAQLAELRAQQEKTIRDLDIKIKMAESEYKIMQVEMSDGHVYAKIDGEIVSVLTEEEARDTKHPIVKVSGGGGFYIEGSISELEMDSLSIGQEVTVNDWNSGMTYTGQVVDLRDFPTTQNGWNGAGNPNVSYYPFRVFVEGEADLQEGSYVSVMYSSSAAEHGIYLENAFIRSEQGRSYVFVQNADGKLEQRFITVGKSLWGSYSEILSGLSEEDLLAFPYGKEVKAGAPTVEAEISQLYSY